MVIAAPIERVFDLARSIDLHTRSAGRTRESAIAGVMSGLIGHGDEVTWRARHFGVWQTLRVRIVAFERPTHFTDTMVHGIFRCMEHHHDFESCAEGAIMRDVFSFESPLGLLGRAVDWLWLEHYMRAFLLERNRVLKSIAESDAWRDFLPAA